MMKYKKLLFPIGAGDDIEPRIYGALKVAQWFNTHMEIMTCQLDPSVVYNMKMTLRGGVLFEEFLKSAKSELAVEHEENEKIFNKICAELGIKVTSEIIEDVCTANFTIHSGKRSAIVEQESKFCDLVVAAVPLDGKITGTFESAVLKSGKNFPNKGPQSGGLLPFYRKSPHRKHSKDKRTKRIRLKQGG